MIKEIKPIFITIFTVSLFLLYFLSTYMSESLYFEPVWGYFSTTLYLISLSTFVIVVSNYEKMNSLIIKTATFIFLIVLVYRIIESLLLLNLLIGSYNGTIALENALIMPVDLYLTNIFYEIINVIISVFLGVFSFKAINNGIAKLNNSFILGFLLPVILLIIVQIFIIVRYYSIISTSEMVHILLIYCLGLKIYVDNVLKSKTNSNSLNTSQTLEHKSNTDSEYKFEMLKKLYEQGHITKDEYDSKKKDLLDKI